MVKNNSDISALSEIRLDSCLCFVLKDTPSQTYTAEIEMEEESCFLLDSEFRLNF